MALLEAWLLLRRIHCLLLLRRKWHRLRLLLRRWAWFDNGWMLHSPKGVLVQSPTRHVLQWYNTRRVLQLNLNLRAIISREGTKEFTLSFHEPCVSLRKARMNESTHSNTYDVHYDYETK